MAAAAHRVPDRVGAADFPCFDGLRAIAAVSVAITHAGFVSGFNITSDTFGPLTARLDIGVAIFFVISGFLLYRPFAAARLTNEAGPAVLPYARRRALRIFPAYWVALTAVLLIPALRWNNDGANVDGLDWVAHYSLVHTYHLRFDLIPVQQAWTLVTEIAFYVMLPIWAAVLRRFSGTPHQRLRHELIGLGVLFGIGLASRTFVLFAIDNPAWRGTINLWLPPRLDHFALGMLLAVGSVWFREHNREPAWARHRVFPYASWAVAALTFWYISFGFGLQDYRGQGFFSLRQEWFMLLLWGIVGVATVAPAVFGDQSSSAIHRLLRVPPMVYCGMISYGIYLWHEAALDLLIRWKDLEVNGLIRPYGLPRVSAFMFAMTIPLAVASYRLIERPALSLKSRPVRQWFSRRGVPA